MSRATRDSAAARSLLARVESRSTGKLTVGAGTAEVAVYLLNGDVVAATSPEDDKVLVRMLSASGAVAPARAAALTELAEQAGDVFSELMALGLDLETVLAERFRQNLADYLASVSAPRFLDQRGMFVTNIQVGHDTRRLIDELCHQSDVAKAVDPENLVTRGRADPGADPMRRRIVAAASSGPVPIATLLDGVPLESLRGRVLVAEMLATGALCPPQSPEAEVEVEPSDEISNPFLDDLVGVAATATRTPASAQPPPPAHAGSGNHAASPSAPSGAASAAPAAGSGAGAVAGAVTAGSGSAPTGRREPPQRGDPPTRELRSLRGGPPGRQSPSTEIGQDDPTPNPSPPVRRHRLAPPVVDDDEDVDDARTEQVDRTMFAHAKSRTRSLSNTLNRTDVEDDELSIFLDHDHVRGSDGDGQFRTDSRDLERVEVASMTQDGEIDDGGEVLEADEAPVARFGAPVLTRGDALAKIDVANEVLAVVSAAFDGIDGPGRGRAVMQLLVDGVPSQFAPVLHDLRVLESGELPTDVVIRNLNLRPATEHRQLLNNCLVDLVDRALSAMDELPEEAVDEVLSSAAGFRQRLGL